MKTYSLSINKKKHDIKLSSDRPLLWVLRDHLNLKGTKFGCGQGLCGACSVHLNAESVRSCQTMISDCEGQEITTIEGIAEDKDNKIIKAWAQENVPQCGYCQPGQIMSATSLCQQIKRPTDQDIDDHMMGNICRCGTYQRIKKAIKIASDQIG